MRRMLLAMLIWSAAAPGTAWAQDEEPVAAGRDWQLGIDFSGWASSGYTHWSFSGDDINYLSELRWRGTDSYIGQVTADVAWKRLVFTTSYGQSIINNNGNNNGVLIDDDFDLNDHQGRCCHTRSAVDGNGVWYVTADVGGRLTRYRVADNPQEGYLDLLVGYQYWHEKYEAFGATGFNFFDPAVADHSIKLITHTYSWQGLRLGFRQFTPVAKGFGIKGNYMFLPYTWAQMKDIHWLRDDLKHNPSFSARAHGGFGFQGDIAVTYSFLSYFLVEVGYRYWTLNPGQGDKFSYPIDGPRLKDKLQDITISRAGPFIGFQARW